MSPRRGGALGRRVATFERRGRFTIAEPLFERGPQGDPRSGLDPGRARRDRAGRLPSGWRPRPALARLRRVRARRGRGAALGSRHGPWLRGRARVRGRRGRRRGARGAAPASRPHSPPHVHGRSGHGARFRRRRLGRGRGRRRAALGPHRGRRRPRAARRRPRLRGAPPRHQHLRPGDGGADASRGAQRRGLQPRAAGGPAGRDRRDRAGLGRRASGGELLPEPHPLRRAPGLRPAGRDLRRPRPAAAGGGGAARPRPPRRRARWPLGGRSARSRSSRSSPSSASTPTAP